MVSPRALPAGRRGLFRLGGDYTDAVSGWPLGPSGGLRGAV